MTPADFRAWRDRCGYPTWAAVALDLGLELRSVMRYAAPVTSKTHQPIPPHIKITCALLEATKKPARGRAGRVSQLS